MVLTLDPIEGIAPGRTDAEDNLLLFLTLPAVTSLSDTTGGRVCDVSVEVGGCRAMLIKRHDFLPAATGPTVLSTFNRAVQWAFAAGVVYGTDWYEWLTFSSGLQGGA